MRNYYKLTTVAVAIFAVSTLFGEIKMPKIFSDNMVLQRELPVKVWGKSDPSAKIRVVFADAKAETTADGSGDWLAVFAPLSADKTGKTLSVFENGRLGVEFKNVLVGEVWVSSGQSNMQFAVGGLVKSDREAVVAAANNPIVRAMKMEGYAGAPVPQWDLPLDFNMLQAQAEGKETKTPTVPEFSLWHEVDKKTVVQHSAVAYLAARKIQRELDVPVGIIGTALGGSSMICWVPKEYIKSYKVWQKNYDEFNAELAAYNFKDAFEKWKPEYEKACKEWSVLGKKGKPRKPYKPTFNSPRRYYMSPTFLYNAKIAPIKNFTVRGVMWYQGENDSSSNFDKKLSAMIAAWRDVFGQKQMPFVVVQMPSFKSDWTKHRLAQMRVYKSDKNVGLVNAIDTGVENDIHPKDKIPVADRMADIILAQVYNRADIHPYGPIAESAEFSDSNVVVKFSSDGRGLVFKGEPRGLEVRIEKNKWVPASAKISGDTLVATAPNNAAATGIRYLAGKFPKPKVCIYNRDGLPAYQFEFVK